MKNNSNYNTELLLEVCRKDEMQCVINGIYKLFNVKKSIIKYDHILKAQIPIQIKSPLYPFIIANIGSGISILKSILIILLIEYQAHQLVGVHL